MKAIRITKKILRAIKPESILYAEFAEEGAMGACGTARIFTLEDEKLEFYLIDDIFNNKDNLKIYGETIEYLKNLEKNGALILEYAGYGNYAYKTSAPQVKFSRDDDHATFIYKDTKKDTYKIPASCMGVYDHVVAKFAEREVSIELLEDYFNQNQFKLSSDEAYFYEQYCRQIRRNDAGERWIDITALDYYKAVQCLRHLSGEDYILNNQDLTDGARALSKYRLKYISEKLGWNKLDKIFAQMVHKKTIDLSQRIKKSLGESVEEIYSILRTVVPNHATTRVFEPESLEKLFDQPVLVEFSKAEHTKIIKEILEKSANSFNPDGKVVAFYLANYLLNEDKLPFSDILPAVVRIVEVMPNDDFNHTHTDELFWLSGEILDRAWRYLEENEKTQEKYRDMMYAIYWPRVGSLWPVLHRDEIEFKHESASKIFDDALSFVMSLDDITERNQEIKSFLDANARHIGYKAGSLGRRAFVYTLRGLSAKQEFETILKTIEPQDYCSYLSYPSGIKEAELLLDELFRTDTGARINGVPRLATFESLLITPNTIGVGEYILGYIDEHFDEFAQIVSTEALNLGTEPIGALTDMFIAMSKGITEENEFPALKNIKMKLLELGCDNEKLTNAEKYARHHRRTVLFQRSALQKLF